MDMKRTEGTRLSQLGSSLIALGDAVKQMELCNPQQSEEKAKALYSKVYQQVCRFCSKTCWCWEEERAYTMEALTEACNVLDERGLSTETAFSSRFQGRCHRTGALEIALISQIEICRQQESRQTIQQEQRETIAHQLVQLGEQMQLMRDTSQTDVPAKQLVVGHASSGKETVSGDSWGVQDLEDGRMVQMLSDGMGSGEFAMQQSRLAVGLLQALLSGGLSMRLALNIVNTVLSFQYGGARFSTMDVSLWNLNTGRLELYKYGSAPSFIKNGRQVKRYDSDSLPVGILPRVEPVLLEHEIAEGDMLVMMSDGLYELNSDGFVWETIISCIPGSNPQLAAEYLMAIAASRIRSNQKKEAALHPGSTLHTDDMTILVSRLV